MVGSGRGDLCRLWATFVAVPDQKFPFVPWVLKRIEVECY